MKDSTKEKTKEVFSKVKDYLDKGWNVTKKGLGKAGDAVQDFSDKSVVTLEVKQLEAKKKKQLLLLGEKAYELLSKKDATVSSKDEEIATLLSEIKKIDKEISKKEKALKADSAPDAKDATVKAEKKTSSVKKVAEKKTTTKKTATKKVAEKKATKKEE